MAQAPARTAPTEEWRLWKPSVHAPPSPHATTPEEDPGDFTSLGAATGFGVALVGAGALLMWDFRGDSPASASRDAATIVFAVGAPVATALGAHLGNRRRGNVWVSLAATGATMAASLLVLDAIHDSTEGRSRGPYVVVPVLTILAATVTELSTMK